MSRSYAFREKHGVRWFWHVGERSCFNVEFYWWTHFAHISVATDSEPSWKFSIALPPLALWITLDGFGLWHPQRKCVATWSDGHESWIPEDRECQIAMHDWTLRLTPWGKSMEWCRADPWWVRGISIDLANLFLGRQKYTTATLKTGIPLEIPMPEGVYRAVGRIERSTWKRSRWFAQTRTYVSVDVPKGIPFAGKGENAYDCDDDGLFGYSSEGESIEKAIAHGVESVLNSRRRYGHASTETISRALAHD